MKYIFIFLGFDGNWLCNNCFLCNLATKHLPMVECLHIDLIISVEVTDCAF